MPDDLSVASVVRSPTVVAVRAEAPPASPAPGAAGVAPFPQPVTHLDAALGIEVMQFVGQGGEVAQSFPSQRQLESYREAVPGSQPAVPQASTGDVASVA